LIEVREGGEGGEKQFISEGWTAGDPFPAEFPSAPSGVPPSPKECITADVSSIVMWSKHQNDHYAPNDTTKNEWGLVSIPSYVFLVWCL
jgi:hypothetical protein